MKKNVTKPVGALFLALALLGASLATAQVNLPQASQRAQITQTIGATQISVDYSRPKVNEREIWGGLVPYGQVWRAGANENTVVEFSDDVKIEGQNLAAGTYGLHMIPGEEEWTVIFSENSSSWGSFSYNEQEDALRVTVKPQENPHHELLTFDVVDQDNTAGTLVLNWGKLQVPVKVEVDTHDVVLADLRNQLRGTAGFNWMGWNQAANYCLQNDVNLEEAMTWVDASIQREERFENLNTKSQLLAKAGEQGESEVVMARALEKATPLNLHNYARQLIGQGDPKKAMEIFKLNGEKHPDVWFIDVGMARGYSALGQYDKAADSLRAAIPKAPEPQRPFYETLIKQLENGESIN